MTETEILKLYGELVGVTGSPEWAMGLQCRMRWEGGCWRGELHNGGQWVSRAKSYDPHEALCIWRDHVRTWLVKWAQKHKSSVRTVHGAIGVSVSVCHAETRGTWHTQIHDTIDEALIEAAKWAARQVAQMEGA